MKPRTYAEVKGYARRDLRASLSQRLGGQMFSIEHEFDATVIVLMDEGEAPLEEDVTVTTFEDYIVIEQFDPISGEVKRVTLSMQQLQDLGAALNLPGGVYRHIKSEGG